MLLAQIRLNEYNIDVILYPFGSARHELFLLWLKRQLTSGVSLHGRFRFFTNEDWSINKALGKRARLIPFPEVVSYDDYPQAHKKYIELREAAEENKSYKCSIRDRWYIASSVRVPDAFFLRRNNFYPKFVLNECNAVSTDTMHRMKFYFGVWPENVLLSYYNSISFAFTEICGRSYSGGILEILPGEMGNIVLPKIIDIDPQRRAEPLQGVDGIVRKDEDIEAALDIVNQEILVDMLGIDPAWCTRCRTIWRKLQKRRLGRG